jgi:hypothetical protein
LADKPHQVAAREKALADEADKLRQAAARKKALVDKAKKRREAAAHAKALAAKVLADERGGQELAVGAKVFAAQALAITTSLPPRPTSYVGAVLSTLEGVFCRLCCLCCWMWGVPILSVIVAYHFHHRSAHMADIILTAFVADMAHRLPIHMSPFFVVGNIGLALPTNLLGMNELTWTWGNLVASCSFGGTWEIHCFLIFWRHLGILLLPVILEVFGEFFCFLFF